MATRHHPLAKYPLDGVRLLPECRCPREDRTYLTALMIEASLMQCQQFVQGDLLDVGCGMKPYEKTWFSNASKYVGLDYSAEKSKADVIGTALELPFADSSFQTVVSTEVLEHVPNPLRALSEIRRVLKVG